ncbi:NAD(P)-dependent glycerol-3-phosphate dehydrogenase [Candidatus Sumerlaeota bacterium]|nr:NAD(P)-dependent glycerol-3-phosphate dehydrogenase [Candidatus Sumerlaeota bacterium]
MAASPREKAVIAVLGAGSWGSTLATLLHDNGHDVRLWDHSVETLRKLWETGHPPGVPELRLPPIPLSSDLAEAMEGVDAAVFGVPAQAYSDVCERIRSLSLAPPLCIIVSKGIDLRTLRPLSDLLAEEMKSSTVAVVSGPCIAREVAQGVPTSVVAACADAAVATRIQGWFNGPAFRVYTQGDLVGVEYAGAYKNVIAIAAGICDGLGFGANSKSALLTRGLAEMRRFVSAMGANDMTVIGLAGLGDLCVTCFSPHSRNRRFGEALGRGRTAEEIIAEIGEVVEGAPTAHAICRIADERKIVTPIARAVVCVIDKECSPKEAVARLMNRELTSE